MAEVLTKIITETLSSGVEPLHRKYYGIYDGYGEVPIAYLTETEVFTAASGIVADYRNAIENTEVGRRFSLSCIASAIRAVRGLREVDRQVSFITAEVTGSFLSGNVLKDLDGLLDDVSGEKICLAFSEKTLTEGGEKVKGGIADARGMGFSTAVYGFNGEESLSALMRVPVNYAFLSPEMTALTCDRNKSGLFTALTGLMRSLRISTVLCGVNNDDAIRDATAAECFGIMPSQDYSGQFGFRKGGADFNDIISDGERVL